MVFEKRMQYLLGMLLFFVCSAHAAVTYTVTSEPYSTGTGDLEGTFSGSMKLTGQFTLDSPFAPNLSGFDFSALVTSYSFQDGVISYSPGNSFLPPGGVEVTTDSSGQITFLQINVLAPPLPHSTSPATLINVAAFEYAPLTGFYVFALDGAPCTALVGNLCDEADDASALGLVSLDDVVINLSVSATIDPALIFLILNRQEIEEELRRR